MGIGVGVPKKFRKWISRTLKKISPSLRPRDSPGKNNQAPPRCCRWANLACRDLSPTDQVRPYSNRIRSGQSISSASQSNRLSSARALNARSAISLDDSSTADSISSSIHSRSLISLIGNSQYRLIFTLESEH